MLSKGVFLFGYRIESVRIDEGGERRGSKNQIEEIRSEKVTVL